MNKIFLGTPFVLMVLLVSSAFGQEKYAVRNVLPDGRYSMEQNLLVSFVISSKDTSSVTQTKSKFYWDFSVESSAGQTTRLVKMKPTRVVYQYSPDGASGNRIFYDSDYPTSADKKLDYIYRNFIETEFLLTLSEKNEVVKIDGLKEVWDKIDQNEDKEIKRTAQVLKTSITETIFSDSFNQLNYAIPSEEVAVGDTWETNVSIDLPVYGKTETVWQNSLKSILVENGRKYCVVESNSDMVLEQNDADVKNTTTAEYDLETGLNRKVVNYSKVTTEQDVEVDDEVRTIKTVALIRGNQTIVPQ